MGSLLAFFPFLCGCPSPSPRPPASTPPASAGPPLFRDVAAEAGLTFRWGHQGRSPLTILETAGGGAGFIDYDGDGWQDIVLVGNRVALYHNEQNGKFREVSAGSGLNVTGELMGLAVGDFDNDGRPDIFITGYGVARLYRNQDGKGRFEDVTAKAGVGPKRAIDWATSAGFADLDGDDWLDLVVCHYVEFSKQARQFCDYVGINGEKIAASCPPLYYTSQFVRVFRNRGNGTFEEKTASLPRHYGNSLGVSFADYNDDGRMDFYVANDAQPGDLYRNEGNWKFVNAATESATSGNQEGREQAGMGVDWGDYDRDGKLDLVVTTFDNEPKSLYKNEGKGLFAYTSYLAGIGEATLARLAFGVAFVDYTNGGFPGLIFANGHVQDTIAKIRPPATYAQPLMLFRNNGNGTFTDDSRAGGPAFEKPIVGRALAVGDYNNDGKPDILIADLEGAPLLMRNEHQTTNHWLGLRLKTQKRDALGARVTIESVGRTYVAESQTCRSYLTASDARLLIGLGESNSLLRLTVRWPSGKTQVISDPPVNQYLTIEER